MAKQGDPMSYEAALLRNLDPDRAKRVQVRGQREFMGAIRQICTEGDPTADQNLAPAS